MTRVSNQAARDGDSANALELYAGQSVAGTNYVCWQNVVPLVSLITWGRHFQIRGLLCEGGEEANRYHKIALI
jgi:hypothetical protein